MKRVFFPADRLPRALVPLLKVPVALFFAFVVAGVGAAFAFAVTPTFFFRPVRCCCKAERVGGGPLWAAIVVSAVVERLRRREGLTPCG